MDMLKYVITDGIGPTKEMVAATAEATNGPAWGKHLLSRFKVENGKRYQLHATKGWRVVGRA